MKPFRVSFFKPNSTDTDAIVDHYRGFDTREDAMRFARKEAPKWVDESRHLTVVEVVGLRYDGDTKVWEYEMTSQIFEPWMAPQ
jgi:hypothetical protein